MLKDCGLYGIQGESQRLPETLPVAFVVGKEQLKLNCEIQVEDASWHKVPFVQEWAAAAGSDAALNGVKVKIPEFLFSKLVPMACPENLLVAIWKMREFKGGVHCGECD